MLKRILIKIYETKWKYVTSHSNIRVKRGGTLKLHNNVIIKNSNIYIDSTSSVELFDNVRLENISMHVTNGGSVKIGENTYFEQGMNAVTPVYIINSGNLNISDHCQIHCQRLWIRFGGIIKIDKYTNINSGSEIRADENVKIGKFCQISYNTRIWDTNTHNIYPPEIREKMTLEKFPKFGFEYERPKTSPVTIGDGVWIGEKVSILKGVIINENVIVGYNTTLSKVEIPARKTVVQKIELNII